MNKIVVRLKYHELCPFVFIPIIPVTHSLYILIIPKHIHRYLMKSDPNSNLENFGVLSAQGEFVYYECRDGIDFDV